jgi:hypothetical protein
MKHFKMLGLAIVAAAALMALVGAGTASATGLCKNNETTSYCNEPYGAGTEIASRLVAETKWKLKTEPQTVECSKSTISGKTENAGEGEAVKEPLTALTFSECNCTVSVLKTGSLKFESIAGTNNGTMKLEGNEITTLCSTIFGNVHCIYGAESIDLGTLTGGNPAKADSLGAVPRLTTSFLCSSEAIWEASYEITAPKPLYVTQDVLLVLKPPNWTFGKQGEVKGITIENRGKVTIKSLAFSVVLDEDFEAGGLCKGATLLSGGSCLDTVKCKKAGTVGAMVAASVNPQVSSPPGDLKC